MVEEGKGGTFAERLLQEAVQRDVEEVQGHAPFSSYSGGGGSGGGLGFLSSQSLEGEAGEDCGRKRRARRERERLRV
jgi:hypothetical protein